MQVRKLKRILKDTDAEIIAVDKNIFMYLNDEFKITENYASDWSIGSLRTFYFDTEAAIKKTFKKCKLFARSCPDEGDKLVVTAFMWRLRPWLK